jgi:hypothetical protein
MRRLLVLMSAVLTLTACQTPTPVTLHTNTASYTVDLDLDAASPGTRTATIHVAGAGAEPTQVTLTTVMAHMKHPGPTVQASRLDDGQYQAQGEFFTMFGDWHVEVRLHGPAGEEVALFEVTAAR